MLIRAATGADAGGIQAVYAPVVEGTPISFEEVAPTEAEMARRMLAEPRLPWLVAADEGRVAGYAYASLHHQRAAYRWSADCSIYLAAGYRSRGLGRRLYEQLIPELERLGYASLFAGVTLPNPASVRLHESLGFEAVGVYRRAGYKQGAWHDVGWWQRQSRHELPTPPAEPRPWMPRPAPGNPALPA